MLKTKTPVAPAETAGFTQKLARAESEIARLAAQENQIALQLQTDQAELNVLASQTAAHDLQKQTAQDTINTRRSALKESEAQAELAEGTLSEKPDLKALERLLKQAQQEQLVILDRIGKAEQAEERRRLALTEAIERHYQTLATLSERREAMETARERVFAEQGETTLQQCLNQLNALQADLAAKEQAITQARENIDDFTREALQSLVQWPECQDTLSKAAPYDDTTTATLEAAIGLLDILLTNGHNVERFDTILLREAGINFGSIQNLLSWDESACSDALFEARRSEPVTLQQKQKDLGQLLEVYRAHKKGEVK